jgi:crossover junction endodeoxyribonuclease RuvC
VPIIGIDPGAGGAIALLDETTDQLQVWDMPTYSLTINGKPRRVIADYELGRLLRGIKHARLAVIEKVHSMPKQGVASSFSFGDAFGGVRCAVATLQIPMELVEPSVWKRGLRVSADKDSSRYRASQLFPKYCEFWSKASQDGRAEAALLAYFGLKFFNHHDVLE